MGGDSHETENTGGEKWLYPLDWPDFLGAYGSMAAVVLLDISPAAPKDASALWL